MIKKEKESTFNSLRSAFSAPFLTSFCIFWFLGYFTYHFPFSIGLYFGRELHIFNSKRGWMPDCLQNYLWSPLVPFANWLLLKPLLFSAVTSEVSVYLAEEGFCFSLLPCVRNSQHMACTTALLCFCLSLYCTKFSCRYHLWVCSPGCLACPNYFNWRRKEFQKLEHSWHCLPRIHLLTL